MAKDSDMSIANREWLFSFWLCFTAVCMPYFTAGSMLGLIMLFATSLWNSIATKCWRNKTLTRQARVACYLMLAFVALYLIGIAYSANVAYALRHIDVILLLLIVPFVVLTHNKSDENLDYLGAMMRLFELSLSVTFVVCLVRSVVRMVQGVPFTGCLGESFHPYHHAYLSLYISVGLCYSLVRLWQMSDEKKNGIVISYYTLRIASHVVAILLLAAFMFMADSRAGMLFLLLYVVLCFVVLTFCMRKWKLSLLLVAGVALLALALFAAQPLEKNRLYATAQNITSSKPHKQDVRIGIWTYSLQAAEEHPVFGVGSGDYLDAILQKFADNGYNEGIERRHDAHNQYITTFVAFGIVGVLLLLAMIVWPVVVCIQKRSYYRFFAIFAIAGLMLQCLFESLLRRQSGMVLFCLLYIVILLEADKTEADYPHEPLSVERRIAKLR